MATDIQKAPKLGWREEGAEARDGHKAGWEQCQLSGQVIPSRPCPACRLQGSHDPAGQQRLQLCGVALQPGCGTHQQKATQPKVLRRW